MEAWGLGPQDLKRELIYTRISGYGQTGPKAALPGYASVCEGFGGLRCRCYSHPAPKDQQRPLIRGSATVRTEKSAKCSPSCCRVLRAVCVVINHDSDNGKTVARHQWCTCSVRHLNGYPDRPPVRPNISLGDSLAGLHAAFGAVMALHAQRRLGGAGQVRD